MTSRKPGKEQNIVYLTGWIIASRWRHALRHGKPVLEVTLRTDEQRFDGHHQLLVQGEGALELQAVLDVMTVHAEARHLRRPGEDELDQVAPELLSEIFPEVTVAGSLGGNEVLVESVRYLSLSSQQRRAVKAHVQGLRERDFASAALVEVVR